LLVVAALLLLLLLLMMALLVSLVHLLAFALLGRTRPMWRRAAVTAPIR
jgi:hypothetical protein